MPQIEVLSTDPGREVRVGQGARVIVIRTLQRSPAASIGESVMGVVGTPTNDRGVPNVPVLIDSVQEIFSKWGGFSKYVGDGASTGYNGNVAAMLWRLLVKGLIYQPVDMALKDLSISNTAAVNVPVTVARGALAFTVEESDEVFTCTGHQFVANDTFQIVKLLGGTNLAVATTYHVIAPVVAGVSFKASTSSGGGAVNVTTDGSGILRPTSIATPSFDAATLVAGTRLRRSARTFNIVGEADDEVLTTDEAHGLAVGETVTIAGLTGGSGATAGEYVVATAPTATTLTLTGFAFTTDITAGTLARLAGTFIVRTLSDVAFADDAYAATTVAVAKVSGTVAPINTLDEIMDAPSDSTIVIATTATTTPDDTDAGETLLRYQRAIDRQNVNDEGKSVTVICTDRTEAAINDYLAAHCASSTGKGIMRLCVTAPPVGTSVTNAKAASGNGVKRATLNSAYAIFVHPGWRRRFDPDQESLSAADDYKATFPGQAVMAAKIVRVKPEENPTFVDAEPYTTYGCVELETELTDSELTAHYKAGICAAMMERFEGRWVGSYRDGILANGVQIARQRLTDYITVGAIERAVPWHKRLATLPNRQALLDSVDTWLMTLQRPASSSEQPRIDSYTVDLEYDGTVEEGTLIIQVKEIGNLNVLVIRLSVGSSGFSVLSGGAIAA